MNESLNNILTNLLRTASSNSCGLLVAPALKEKSSLRKWEGNLKMHDRRIHKWMKPAFLILDIWVKNMYSWRVKETDLQVPTIRLGQLKTLSQSLHQVRCDRLENNRRYDPNNSRKDKPKWSGSSVIRLNMRS